MNSYSPSTQKNRSMLSVRWATVAHFVFAFVAGLALTRILFEGLFPNYLWLGRPYFVLPFSILLTILLIHNSQFTIHNSQFPFLLNLLWLFNPSVDLVASRFVFAATVWLTAVLITRDWRLGARGWGLGFVWLALAPVYLLTISSFVGVADTFEFQVVTPQLGIVHPTGYPLYLLLGKLFTLLPLGTLAWRLNFASVVYALAAMGVFYLFLLRLLKRPLPALLATVVTGLTATFWSQAIIAEVYALHALIVVGALFLMGEIGDWGLEDVYSRVSKSKLTILLAVLIGLGMSNHVTSVFLIPSAILTVLFTYHATRNTEEALPLFKISYLLKLFVAFLLPLLLYAYLPLRWQAVNGEAMGMARFVDWVVAGRFQGALQLRAWLDDPTRYAIIWRLFLDNWGWFNLGLALLGFVILLIKNWRVALILFSLWLGYTFYTLNYYVPDLAVFVIPAQIIVGVCWAVGVWGIGDWNLELGSWRLPDVSSLIATFVIIPTLLLAVANWSRNDQSNNDGLEKWGRMVLNLPLAENGAILADGEKIAPLNYLQMAEGLRSDLDISVWPDEAAYREQVDGRIANGQTVYLARQLPNLQSSYYLRSLGPLTEVSAQSPLPNLPTAGWKSPLPNLDFPSIALLGYEIHPPTDEGVTAVTFYWQATEPISDVLHVYTRFKGYPSNAGQHPTNNFYPTNAWKGDEIVSDYHELPHPILTTAETAELQVALAPPFSDPTTLAWQTVTEVELPATKSVPNGRPYRIQLGDTFIQLGNFPTQTRPQTPLPVILSGVGDPTTLTLSLTEIQSPISNSSALFSTNLQSPISNPPFTTLFPVETNLENGRYPLTISSSANAICGWMQLSSASCVLGEVEISGVALPETAVNFADKIGLLNVEIPNRELQAGGQLQLTLNWLTLADMGEDYTITVQILDENDRLVGQTDSWPVQGTRPTSQWQPNERITDPYIVQLDPDVPSGDYRLLIGIYLLGNGRRLPVLNGEGTPINDKFIQQELTVP